MTNPTLFSALNRRLVLARSALATAAAAVAPSLLASKPAAAFRATPEENKQRYKESEHVKNFYKIAGR